MARSAAAGWNRRVAGRAARCSRSALGQFKYQLLTALGVGLAAGAAVYFAGPWLAAAAAGVGAFTATLAVQAGVALKRLWTQTADLLA